MSKYDKLKKAEMISELINKSICNKTPWIARKPMHTKLYKFYNRKTKIELIDILEFGSPNGDN